MQITVNGEQRTYSEPLNLNTLLKEVGLLDSAIIVELNHSILDKSQFKTMLVDGDKIELIRFMGGG